MKYILNEKTIIYDLKSLAPMYKGMAFLMSWMEDTF